MGLFKRMSDIISANLNEMVDKFEDPETMLKQAVREMETAIRSAMDGAAKVIASQKLLGKQLTDHQTQAATWQQRAEAAVRGGDDDTARHALARKREHEKLLAALSDELTIADASSQKLRRQIEAMRVRLAEAKRKLILLTARQRAAEARKKLVTEFGGVAVNDEPFSKFDRMCDKVESCEAEAEALLELSGGVDFEDEFTNAADVEIEAELQQLKQTAVSHV